MAKQEVEVNRKTVQTNSESIKQTNTTEGRVVKCVKLFLPNDFSKNGFKCEFVFGKPSGKKIGFCLVKVQTALES